MFNYYFNYCLLTIYSILKIGVNLRGEFNTETVLYDKDEDVDADPNMTGKIRKKGRFMREGRGNRHDEKKIHILKQVTIIQRNKRHFINCFGQLENISPIHRLYSKMMDLMN